MIEYAEPTEALAKRQILPELASIHEARVFAPSKLDSSLS